MVKKKTSSWPLAAVSIVIFMTFLISVDYFYYNDRIYTGVFVDGVDLSGRKAVEAEKLLQENFIKKHFFDRQVTLEYATNTWTVTYRNLGVEPDYDNTIAEAFTQGRKGVHLFRYPHRLRLKKKHVNLKPKLKIDPTQFRSGVAIAAETVRVEPVNAQLKLTSDRKKVEIIPDQPGQELDEIATLKKLETALAQYPEIAPVQVVKKQVAANVTAVYLESLKIKEPISSFTTMFSSKDANRNHNISLAADAIDQTLLLPGSQFSFNEVVGNTTAAKGYLNAPVIVKGALDEGLGGGICQVSTTLYNAILLADLKIVERKNHGLVVGYVPPGRDATISYGWIDLKFLNDQKHAVWLRTFIDGNRLTITMYGSATKGQNVNIVTSDLTAIPGGEKIIQTPELPKGVREQIKKGQPGYRVTLWRVTSINGKEVKREKISQDTYKAVDAEYLVGTGEVPVSGDDPGTSDPTQENEGETANQTDR